ncbi:MAG: epoxyqueuosine reductase [Candidatus Hydrogenedentota bacterium]|nr:MAG: epoxyqueuosine reductase [Candidatus Hydrogenedentota bacterium]
MGTLKKELVDLAVSMGAVGARVADLETLEKPPSADPTYVLPGAQSVIAFAVPLGTDFIPDYLGKVTRMVFRRVMYEKYQLIGAIGEAMVVCLQEKGFQAVSPSPNGVYRSEVSKRGFMVPDFSLRYAAVASGLGTFGWSGNVLVEGHWSTVFLGAAVTDAVLPPDAPLDKSLCDDCRICAGVCPLEFIKGKESQTVSLGGRKYSYNAKGNHARCGLACSGLSGVTRDGKWSSWATLRYEFPEDDSELVPQFMRALNDPASAYIRGHIGFSSAGGRAEWAIEAQETKKGVLLRSLEDTNPTCCHCVLVCSGPLDRRRELMKLLHSSGVVVRLEDGTEKAIKPEELQKAEQKD